MKLQFLLWFMSLSYSLHWPLFLIKYCHLISINDIKSYLNICFPSICDITNTRFSYNISIYFQSVCKSLNFRDAVCSLRIYLSNVPSAIEYSAQHSSLRIRRTNPRSIIQESSHCRSHRRRRRDVPPKMREHEITLSLSEKTVAP